ncbi:MAG TPA: N-acetylglucosamine-6-phosphate deacetylase, partial [Rectinema sp.]|nr:N-acetylglucosamine-6-phosphate deacetylase [Rectinema sp.]
GHTAASPEQIRAAIKAGATLSTHLGNGSHTMLPRLLNYLWEQLAADELASSIICDGDHLPPAVVRVFLRTKGLERLILVSDGALL